MHFVFVNGIKNDLSEAEASRDRLARLLNRDVDLFYNPTKSFFSDLTESFVERWVAPAAIDRAFADYLEAALDKHVQVVMFAHSQGGIIASNAAALIPHNRRQWLSIVFFGSANSREPGALGWTEYFYNKFDIIRWALVPQYQKNFWGPMYERDGKGHSLIECYLEKLHEFNGFGGSLLNHLILLGRTA